MQTDPYLASIEARIATAKLHAATLVVSRAMLQPGRIGRDKRQSMTAAIDGALELLTTKMVPLSTPWIDDAIAKLDGVDGQDARRAELIRVRAEVHESLEKIHAFVKAHTPQ